eukprot:Nk52_evm11s168 gene=Nk52_evmTU11s168
MISKTIASSLPLVSCLEFSRIHMQTAIVNWVKINENATKPAYILELDIGDKTAISSAQLTERYSCEDIKGKTLLIVTNFKPRKIADVSSAALTMGFVGDPLGVTVIVPRKRACHAGRAVGIGVHSGNIYTGKSKSKLGNSNFLKVDMRSGKITKDLSVDTGEMDREQRNAKSFLSDAALSRLGGETRNNLIGAQVVCVMNLQTAHEIDNHEDELVLLCVPTECTGSYTLLGGDLEVHTGLRLL